MQLGLIGKSLAHSFSKKYFEEKFRRENLVGYSYENFELPDIGHFPKLLKEHPGLRGLNVTIPYKTEVIPYLHSLSAEAEKIGAVNSILIEDGRLRGFNTDYFGFKKSLETWIKPAHKKALVLGSGGAARAVKFTLDQLGISHLTVSRQPTAGEVSYPEAGPLLKDHTLVINTTPLGTFPKIDEMPPLELEYVSENHLFYDLIYNPAKSLLLQKADSRGANTFNGSQMLRLQAEKAWQIWHDV